MKKKIVIGLIIMLLAVYQSSAMVKSIDTYATVIESDSGYESIKDPLTETYCVVMTNMPPEPGPEITRLKESRFEGDPPGDLPDYYSWKDIGGKDFTTPAKSQGNCGSCWAFAAIGMVESSINIELGLHDFDLDLSEQYVLSCLSGAGSCAGGWTSYALNYMLDTGPNGNYVNGVVTEDCFPYTSGGGVTPDCSAKCSDWMNDLWELEDYGSNYYPDTEEGRNQLKQRIIEKGPLGVNFLATDDFINWGSNNHNPDDYYPYTGPVSSLNHAVILVGYKDDSNIGQGGYWICKNSWGTSWGYDGFFNLEYRALGIDDTALWVDVPQGVIIDFDYLPEQVTNEDIITFYPNTTEDIETYWWNFGDGYYSDLEEPIHRFYENGIYTVSLTVTTTTGSTGCVSKDIEVPSGLIEADFEYDPLDPTTQDSIQFTDTSSGSSIDSWDWDFGDGGTSTEQNPAHQYSDNGNYDVTLTITGDLNTDSITKNIQVSNIKPVADFSYVANDEVVSFTDESYDVDGSILLYNWDFGDGGTSTVQNPVHSYSARGPFIVILTVTDDDLDTDSKSTSITLDIGPIADYSYTPFDEPTIYDTIQFTDESIDAISWNWDFGDGNTSTLQNPTHQYNSPGEYDVTLLVYDSIGISDSITKTIDIFPPNVPPTADFTFNPTEPRVDHVVQFTDTSFDSDGTIVNWDWDFGDAQTSTLQNPTHTYTIIGDYTVTLVVTDNGGNSSSLSKQITIFPNTPPIASFSYDPSNPTNLDDIEFTDESNDVDGTIVSWLWNFGDGHTSTEQNPIHSYDSDGDYTVTLTVTDDDGDQGSISITIHVEFAVEYLDQYQDIYTAGDTITYTQNAGQSFKPTVSKITRVEVLLKRDSGLTSDIKLYLRDSLSGGVLTSLTLDYLDVSSGYSWVNFDIDDTDVTSGSTYYITLWSSSYSWNEVYQVGYSQYNTYNNGIYYQSRSAGTSWSPRYYNDMCFKIYGS